LRRREILAGPLALGCLSAAELARPRLFVNRARLDRVKRKISGSHSELWKMVRENAGNLVGRMPPSRYDNQGEMRTAGRGIPWQALVWLVVGEPGYRDGAKRWMLRICEYPRWEQNDSLAAGECLFGVAIGYDWLHDRMDQGERRLVRDKLVLQADAMLNAPPVHHDRWLANHNHVEHLGLAAAGFALRDEVPRAEAWIRQAHAVFRKALEFSGPDGGSTEGHQYWAYSAESILRYAELARDLLKEDLYGNQWLKSVPDFIIHSTLPDFTADNCVMSYGDSHPATTPTVRRTSCTEPRRSTATLTRNGWRRRCSDAASAERLTAAGPACCGTTRLSIRLPSPGSRSSLTARTLAG
jgi:hypothetical protein